MVKDNFSPTLEAWETSFIRDDYHEAYKAGYQQALRDGIDAIRKEKGAEVLLSPDKIGYTKALTDAEMAVFALLYQEEGERLA